MSERGGKEKRVEAAEVGKSRDAASSEAVRKARVKSAKVRRVLPSGPDEDSDRAWGDGDDSNDARLRHEKPPHW